MTPTTSPQPRLDYIDLDLSKRVVASSQEFLQKFREKERLKQFQRPQTSYALAYTDNLFIGGYYYALGLPLETVRSYLVEATRCMERVFKLRGTQSPFPVIVVTLDPTSPPNAPRELDRRPLHPPDAKDYSLTNSAVALQGLYLALIVGDLERGRHIAEMTWDPPDADYIGPDSEVCTPDQQHLAYAVKYAILGSDRAALTELGLINPRTATVDIRHQATMVRAIVAGQSEVFLHGLADLLAWHQQAALQKWNRIDPTFFLSLAGLGLCALAFQRGVIQRESLPSDNVYLPLDLLQVS